MGWRLHITKLALFARIPFGDALRKIKRNWLGYQPDLSNLRDTLQNYKEMSTELSRLDRSFRGANILEIGSGWFPIIPIMLSLDEAAHVYMTDLSPHQDEVTFGTAIKFLRCQSEVAARLAEREGATFPLTYMAPFDVAQVADQSIDYIISRTVLEHIPEDQLIALLIDLKPKLSPNGLMIHLIDHSDHLEHADRSLSKIQFLTWSNAKHQLINWLTKEGENRLRHHEYVSIFRSAGYEVLSERIEIHEPTRASYPSLKLAPRFRHMSADEVSILKSILVAKTCP